MPKKKILFRNTQSPGDIVVLTALIRDLHRTYPRQFTTGVQVSPGCESIFANNPDIVASNDFRKKDKFVAKYPLIHQSNQKRKHFLWGFIDYFNSKFNTDVKLTEFRPTLYMSEQEKNYRRIEEPYWVFLCGGKKDFTTKLWPQSYWQELIDMTCDRINWVQCGTPGHYKHIPKKNTHANMVGKTGFRAFAHLIYHAEGVVCYMTAAMHIAAAFNRPCVVIGGGREPWWWEAYNEENRLANMRVAQPGWVPPADDDFVPHRFIHTIGKLPCCRTHGCWKKWVEHEKKGNRCLAVETVGKDMVAKCKAIITPEQVEQEIFWYYENHFNAANTVHIQPKKVVHCLYSKDLSWLEAMLKQVGEGTLIAHAGAPEADIKRLADDAGVEYAAELSRAQAALRASEQGDWLVWAEDMLKPDQPIAEVVGRLTRLPSVHGRIYREHNGVLYPHPGFFTAPTRLINRKATEFRELFNAAQSAIKATDGLIKLPTTPLAADQL
jgi:ADP-heptose:LPS heptosyltransferase